METECLRGRVGLLVGRLVNSTISRKRDRLLIDGPHNATMKTSFLGLQSYTQEALFSSFLWQGAQRRSLHPISRQKKERDAKSVQQVHFTAFHFHCHTPSCSLLYSCHKVQSLSENRQLLSCQCKGVWGIIFWLQVWRRGPGMFQLPCI